MKYRRIRQLILLSTFVLLATTEHYTLDHEPDTRPVTIQYTTRSKRDVALGSSITEAPNKGNSTEDITKTEPPDQPQSSGEDPGESPSGSCAGGVLSCLCDDSCTKDNHTYYTSTYINDTSLWIEINSELEGGLNGSKHVNLSQSSSNYGFAMSMAVDNFLFYGLPIENNITVLTGGFLHVGEMKYAQYLTQIQYIAPFMGHFNPSTANFSNVFYYSNASIFIFQWENMQIEKNEALGNFTFQVQLHSNSDIIFAYKEIPTTNISDENHANSIGIADAYSLVTASSVMIHVYHKINLKRTLIKSGTGVKLIHQKLCTMISDCYSCTADTLPNFDCRWCGTLNKCSDRGYDSQHNKWTSSGCLKTALKKGDMCHDACYFPKSYENTTYTPEQTTPTISTEDGSNVIKVDCDATYSVSVNYNLTAHDHYTCTAGGIELPKCTRSCNYTVPPQHGTLRGAKLNTLVREGSIFQISCDKNHRVRDSASQVRCIDNGTLEPDPQNVRCEKYCTLPKVPNAQYEPTPQDTGYLHEGEVSTLRCKRNYALKDFLAGNLSTETITVSCAENTDFAHLTEKCVGYCTLAANANTTYTPAKPLIGDIVNVTCDNGTVVMVEAEIQCVQPGLLKLPVCKPLKRRNKDHGSTHSFIILLIIFMVVVISLVGGWVFYAYRNPTSPSGLFLIEKCRPWTWRSSMYRRHESSLAETYYMDGGI